MKFRILILCLITGFQTGCTVVSANRTFPKWDWYWSADAQEQRRENAAEKPFEK